MVNGILQKEYQNLVPTDEKRRNENAIKNRWKILGEQGILGMAFPEEIGGSNQGNVGIMIAQNAIGYNLSNEPFLTSIVIAGHILMSLPNNEEIMEKLAIGECRIAIAYEENDLDNNIANIELFASKNDEDYNLNGHKRIVIDGAFADKAIIIARYEGKKGDKNGLGFFLCDAKNYEIKPYGLIDGTMGADLFFNNTKAKFLGPVETIFDKIFDIANAAIAAQMCGICEALIEITTEYLKIRQQFGVPLAKFQVLQHRLVDMRAEWELLKSAAGAAAMVCDGGDAANRRKFSSAAKVQAIRAGKFISQNAIQLHGAIGMTEECQVGWFAKKIILLSAIFGDEDYHISQFMANAAA